MPLDWRTEWEVRTDGNDNWGGGFFAGRTGATKTATDNYTYGPSYQAWTGTDLIINSTTNTLVRSPGRPFDNADIGHVIQITGGTGFTTGFYEITGSVVDGSDTWWSLDRAAGTAGSTGGSWGLGGALASLGRAGAAHTTGNTIWIRSGTYSITSNSANVSNGRFVAATSPSGYCTRLIGYGTTRGDHGTATLNAGAGVTSTPVDLVGGLNLGANLVGSASAVSAANAVFGGGSWYNCRVTSSVAIGFGTVRHAAFCVAQNCVTTGFHCGEQTGSVATFYGCAAVNCNPGFGSYFGGLQLKMFHCIAHKCAGGVALLGASDGNCVLAGCIVSRCNTAFTAGSNPFTDRQVATIISNTIVTNCPTMVSTFSNSDRIARFFYSQALFVWNSGSFTSSFSHIPVVALSSDPCPQLVDSTSIDWQTLRMSVLQTMGMHSPLPATAFAPTQIAFNIPSGAVRRDFMGGFTL